MSDRDSRFTAHFWKSFQKAMGTRLTMNTAFHPQTDGQSERTIQVLEDMLRACVLDHKGSWEENLPLVEFAYNNSYQASIQMAPYEALYGRPCRSPLCWTEVGESSITGPNLIRDTFEKVSLIRQRLLTAQSRKKSYADVRLLKIKPTSPHACACFSPYLAFLFSFFNFPELMQYTIYMITQIQQGGPVV